MSFGKASDAMYIVRRIGEEQMANNQNTEMNYTGNAWLALLVSIIIPVVLVISGSWAASSARDEIRSAFDELRISLEVSDDNLLTKDIQWPKKIRFQSREIPVEFANHPANLVSNDRLKLIFLAYVTLFATMVLFTNSPK